MIRIAVVAAAVLTTAPALAAERSFNLGGFDRLAASGSPEVVVTTGAGASVRASGADADLDSLDVRVEDGTLKLGRRKDGLWSSWRDKGPVKFTVTVPMLRAVEAAGSGSVTVDRIKVRDFTASLAGSGTLRVGMLDAQTVAFESAGSGSITAAGRCGTGSAKIAGSGRIRLDGLKCETLSASIAGSGKIDAFASRAATLSTMGSGEITVAGGALCTVSSAGSGRARCA